MKKQAAAAAASSSLAAKLICTSFFFILIWQKSECFSFLAGAKKLPRSNSELALSHDDLSAGGVFLHRVKRGCVGQQGVVGAVVFRHLEI